MLCAWLSLRCFGKDPAPLGVALHAHGRQPITSLMHAQYTLYLGFTECALNEESCSMMVTPMRMHGGDFIVARLFKIAEESANLEGDLGEDGSAGSSDSLALKGSV